METFISDLSKLRKVNPDDAGYDIRCANDFIINPNERLLVKTGLNILIPSGYVGYVMSRSGLANKYGIVVLNSPGVIDSGYTGEIMVNLINFGCESVTFKHGDRIAQLIFQKIEYPKFKVIDVSKIKTIRGRYGHGSTLV
ncbi:hypothetical protein [Dasineura jujubifolia toursvirus 2a]|nr:hypothetical protein [Dasineura jujubifolia toursvirus 2a]